MTGISLDQALNGDKPAAAKKKDSLRWRPSTQKPTDEYVMRGRVGGTGMARNVEVKTLRMIDKIINKPSSHPALRRSTSK